MFGYPGNLVELWELIQLFEEKFSKELENKQKTTKKQFIHKLNI